jgi:hypothetical protein
MSRGSYSWKWTIRTILFKILLFLLWMLFVDPMNCLLPMHRLNSPLISNVSSLDCTKIFQHVKISTKSYSMLRCWHFNTLDRLYSIVVQNKLFFVKVKTLGGANDSLYNLIFMFSAMFSVSLLAFSMYNVPSTIHLFYPSYQKYLLERLIPESIYEAMDDLCCFSFMTSQFGALLIQLFL